MRPGDVVVANSTRVLPARLRLTKPTGGAVEVLLLERLPSGEWEALVRPSRSFRDLEIKSVKKKLKDKTFCEAIDRDSLKRAADDLGVPFDKHVENVISYLRPIESKIGLGGSGR